MIRTLTNWIACLTVALLLMALVLGHAAHAQEAPGASGGDWKPSGLAPPLTLQNGPAGP
jgi:hypothetical protein